MAQQGPAPAVGAITLMEAARLSNSPPQKAVAMCLYNQGSVLTDIPFETAQTMYKVGSFFDGRNMPRVDHRKINGLPETTKSIPTRWTESAYILSNIITIDKRLENDTNAFQKQSVFQTQAWLEAVKYRLNDLFINGVHDGNPDNDDAPVGIKARIAGSDTTSNPFHVQKGLNINGNIDISPATLAGTGGKAAALLFLATMDSLLTQLNAPDGKGVILYMNEKLRRQGVMALLSLGGGAGFSTTQDQYGRMLETYRGAQIRDIGRKTDQATFVINPYENPDGTDSTATTGASGVYGTDAAAGKNYTSMYAVRFGDGYLSGWQWEALAPQRRDADPGTFIEILFDWAYGWATGSTRSLARVYDIKLGA